MITGLEAENRRVFSRRKQCCFSLHRWVRYTTSRSVYRRILHKVYVNIFSSYRVIITHPSLINKTLRVYREIIAVLFSDHYRKHITVYRRNVEFLNIKPCNADIVRTWSYTGVLISP